MCFRNAGKCCSAVLVSFSTSLASICDSGGFAHLDDTVTRILEHNPKALVIPRVWLGLGGSWGKKHPDQVFTFHDGSAHTGMASVTSIRWKEDAKALLSKMIRHVEAMPWRDRIVGYHLAYYRSGEWFHPRQAGKWADYSKAARDGFARWTKEKYGSDKALSPPPVELPSGLLRGQPVRLFQPGADRFDVGYKMVVNMRGSGGGISVSRSSGITLQDLVVYAAGSFAFHESGRSEGGNVYRRCKLVPRPGSPSIWAGAADAFHSMNQRRGPHLVDCEFSWAFDDLINIHGFINLVIEKRDSDHLLLLPPSGRPAISHGLAETSRTPSTSATSRSPATRSWTRPAWPSS